MKQTAIAGFLTHGTVSAACQAAGIGRRSWYDWLEQDAVFKELVEDAREAVGDGYEQEAQRRAIEEGSDTLLIFMLKALRPGKYRDRQVVTVFSPEVQVAVRSTIELIASRPSWNSQELLDHMEMVWK